MDVSDIELREFNGSLANFETNCTTFLPDPTPPERTAWITGFRTSVVFIVSLLIVISNVLNMVVIRQTTQIPTIARLCLLNLSSADLLAGVIACLPSTVSSAMGHWPYGPVWCQVSGLFHSMSVSMSIWSLALVSVDRYIAIMYPLRYMALMTENRTRGIICVLWVLDIILYTSPMMASPGFLYYQYSREEAICGLYWGFRAFCYFTAGCVPVLSGTVIVFTNFRVFQSVLRLRRTVNALPSHNPPATSQPGATSTRGFKAVKVLLITSVTYFLMWGPYVVVNVFMMPFYPELAFSSGLLFSVMWLANSNSFINVVIYSCFYRGFRSRAWRLIITCCGMRSRGRVASTQRPESVDIDTVS